MSRPVCGICMCLIDETGCGCNGQAEELMEIMESNNEPVAWNYDNGKWEVCVDGYAVWLDSSDFTHDASLQVAGDFVDLPQKFAYAEEIAKRLNNSLYTHPAKTEEFMAGDAICPSCGCKSLYKTARSEWCVTHKCLWQKDYELTLTDEEIKDIWMKRPVGKAEDIFIFARAILRKAQDK